MTEFNEANAPAPSAPMMTIGLVAVGAVILVAAGVFVATSRWSSGSGGSPVTAGAGLNAMTGEEHALKSIQQQVQREADERSRASRTLAETRASGLLEQVSNTRGALENAKGAFTRWGSQVPALLTSDDGKRIAADPVRVQTFAAIYNRSGRPAERALSSIEERVAVIEVELLRVKNTADTTLSPETEAMLKAQLDQEQAAADIAMAGVQEDLHAVDALIAQAKSDSLGVKTLEAALRDLELEHAEKRAEKIRTAVAAVLVESRELDADMEARKRREITDAERRQAEADLELERMRKDSAAALTEEKAILEERQRRAESGEVQAKYSPLLTNGRARPHGHAGSGNVGWEMSNALELAPVSMKDIEGARALESFDRFVRMMTITGNDRGAWPQHGNNPQTIATYRERFEEFKELAPLWLKMGKLRD